MSEWVVPLASFAATEDDIDAVVATYRSGWLTMGPRIRELEDRFASFTGARHAIAVSNGTAALHLICVAAGIGPGDQVIVPSLTFIATANCVRYVGARPVLADIAGLTHPWLSAAACEEAITPATKAIMYLSYGGHAGELEAIRRLCERRGLLLLEDAAHAAGSRLDGRHLGTFGLAGAFSMYSNKNLAIGEGGMVVTDDDAVAERVRLLRSHAMTAPAWDRHRGLASDYDVVDLGFNYRMDEPRAALATNRLLRLDDENARRGELVASYRALLHDLDVVISLELLPGMMPSHHLFTIVVPERVGRADVRAHLASRGVQTSVHYPPIHCMANHEGGGWKLPLTENYTSRTVTLPLYADMTQSQVELVVDALREALERSA